MDSKVQNEQPTVAIIETTNESKKVKSVGEIRSCLDRLSGKTLSSDSIHFQSVVELFQNHPTWNSRLKEIKGFRIFKKKGKLMVQLQIESKTRKSGLSPWFIVSWRRCAGCIDGKKSVDPENLTLEEHKRQLLQSMRLTIQYQINRFRRTHSVPRECPSCFNNLVNVWHVDHIEPFSILADTFLLKPHILPNIPTKFRFHRKSCKRTFQDKDRSFKKLWQEFHNNFANFQYLCAECNVKKGNKLTP